MSSPPGDDGKGQGGGFTERIRTGARRAFKPEVSSTAVTEAIVQPLATRKHLPVRYHIKEDDQGRYLTCVEASNIAVRIERGLSVSPGAARKYPHGTIFLDGAAQGEPFMDASKGVYNLDHHEGCVRAFTLATCEQAMVVILKGLDLDDEAWTAWANEPDFDTVLAIWLLLNHRRLDGPDPALRRRMMPIVRLQGVIDAHGFELKELTAFPDHLQDSTLEIINELRSEELALKGQGEWDSTDLLEFTRATLQKIDDLVYTPGDFEGMREVEELARVRISPQRLGVVCRSDTGIYEVEEQLREVHGDRLGLVILQKDESTYTLRQVDPFLPTSLDNVYERLNLLDSAVDGENRWGGSGDIGGSPRRSGTALTVDEIVSICRWVFQPPSRGRRRAMVGMGVVASLAVVAVTVLAGGGAMHEPPGLLSAVDKTGYSIASLALFALGMALVILGRSRFPGYFGMRLPRRPGFLALLPVTAAAALCGAGWIPLGTSASPSVLSLSPWWNILIVLAGAAGIEVLLRGALHGLLVTVYEVKLNGSRLISVPNAVAALVYAAVVPVCFSPPGWLPWAGNALGAWLAWLGAALLMGLTLGMARERWGSVWVAVLLHGIGVLVALFAFFALF